MVDTLVGEVSDNSFNEIGSTRDLAEKSEGDLVGESGYKGTEGEEDTKLEFVFVFVIQ